MKYKAEQIEIPESNPYLNDKLGRKDSIDTLNSLLDNLNGPFTLAVDAPWGMGKTTFINFWQRVLEAKNCPCLYFNAWEADFSSDPLTAFIGEISSQFRDGSDSRKKRIDKLKEVANVIARRSIPLAIRLGTFGILDIDPSSEKAIADMMADTTKTLVDQYLEEKENAKELKKQLEEIIESLTENGEDKKLIIFVDEIDRCRPTFALELLERIKHLFNTPNLIFVLAIDKPQLEISLSAVYGQEFNSKEYLRRFIDLEFQLRTEKTQNYLLSLFDRFEINFKFKRDQLIDNTQLKNDFLNTFLKLSKLFGLSLRAQEQCFSQIVILITSLPDMSYFTPHLSVFLILLKAFRPDLYEDLVLKNKPIGEVIKSLNSISDFNEFLESPIFDKIIVNFIMAKSQNGNFKATSEFKSFQQQLNTNIGQVEKERILRQIKILEKTSDDSNDLPSLGYLINNIELSTQFKK